MQKGKWDEHSNKLHLEKVISSVMWICILALSCTDAEKMDGTNFFLPKMT